jgi:hypothetical protein
MFDPAAQALFVAMTTPPTPARQTIINTAIVALKSAGIWALLDVLYMLAAADAQAASLNWVAPSTFPITASGCTFTADQGYTGGGATTNCLTSGYNPTNGPQYTMNSAVAGAYVRAATTLASTDIIAFSGATLIVGNAVTPPTQYNTRINDGTNLLSGAVTMTGHFALLRAAATAKALYRAGASIATATTASTATGITFYLLSNTGGTGANANAQISFAYAGAALTDPQMGQMDSALVAGYLHSVGAA